MVNVSWYNEKGNVSVKVREGVRAQVLSKVLKVLTDAETFEDVTKNANGGITIPVAEDRATGKTIYAHFEMTVNDKDGTTKTERKKSAKKKVAEEVEVPDIFADSEDEDSDEDGEDE